MARLQATPVEVGVELELTRLCLDQLRGGDGVVVGLLVLDRVDNAPGEDPLQETPGLLHRARSASSAWRRLLVSRASRAASVLASTAL